MNIQNSSKNKFKKLLTETTRSDKISFVVTKDNSTQFLENWTVKHIQNPNVLNLQKNAQVLKMTAVFTRAGRFWKLHTPRSGASCKRSEAGRWFCRNENLKWEPNLNSKYGNERTSESWRSSDPRSTILTRVRSWLRMNAGGVPNTCKSSDE